jgi:hypothetical protein
VVLLGDLNGHVGADADEYVGIHGGFGYGVRNMEGCRVLELGDAHGMVVGNKLFTRSSERLITSKMAAGLRTIFKKVSKRCLRTCYIMKTLTQAAAKNC